MPYSVGQPDGSVLVKFVINSSRDTYSMSRIGRLDALARRPVPDIGGAAHHQRWRDEMMASYSFSGMAEE